MAIDPITPGDMQARVKLNDAIAEANKVPALVDVYTGHVNEGRERPGDSPVFFTEQIGGEPSGIAPIAIGSVVAGPEGKVLRVPGAGEPRIVARRQVFGLEPGEVYAAKFSVRRARNSSDPLNDAVQFAVAWLDRDKSVIATEIVVSTGLSTFDGVLTRQISFSRDQDAQLIAPDLARYAVPFVKLFGGDTETDVITVDLWRTTNLPGPKGDTGDVTDAALAARQASIDAAVGAVVARDLAEDARDAAIGASNALFNFDTLSEATAALGSIATNAGVNVLGDGANQGYYVKQGGVLVKKRDYTLPDLDGLISRESGRFKVMDEDGLIVFETSPERGVGIGGVWMDALASGLFRVRDSDGFVPMEVDLDRGLMLPGADLRPSQSSLFRILDRDYFVYLDIDNQGQVKFSGQSIGQPTPVVAQATRIWSGAVTDTGFKVNCDLTEGGNGLARMIVSTDSFFTERIYVSPVEMAAVTEAALNGIWRSLSFAVEGLDPDTLYYYGIEVDGRFDPLSARSVRTLPPLHEPAAFRIVFGSCSGQDALTTTDTHERIAAENPVLLFHLGDIVYSDIAVDDITLQRASNSRLYRSNPSVDFLNKTVPIAYVFDDHDAGPNDGHWDVGMIGGSTYQQVTRNARRAIRETVPHYPFVQTQLGEVDPDKTILTQVIDIAKARFIFLDTRSQRRYVEGAPTCLGNGTNPPGSWDQLGWLIDTALPEAAAAASAEEINRVFLISPSGWTGAVYDGWQEHWTAEQTLVCNAIRDTPGLPVLTILTGDFHYCAADDGGNTDTSDNGGARISQLMASPFYKGKLTAGGPFSWAGANGKQTGCNRAYCVLDVAADGEWTATFKGSVGFTGSWSTLGVYSSTDQVPEVGFAAPSQTAPASSSAVLVVSKSWFGPAGGCGVHWSTSDGQSGDLDIDPNASLPSFAVTAPASGSITVTLSSGENCTLGDQTVLTLTASSG